MRGLHTVKGQIQTVVILVVTISLILVGGTSCWLSYTSTIQNAEVAIERTARIAAEDIYDKHAALMNVVEVLGTMEELASNSTPLNEKRKILDETMAKYSFRSSRIMDTKGISIFDPDKDLSSRDYFKTAMTGQVAISDPIFSSTNGELITTIAAPVWKDGKRNTQIVGVVMVTQDATWLSEVVAHINVSENGSAYLINGEGTVIAHADIAEVEEEKNTIKLAQGDSTYAQAAAIQQRLVNGESGVGYQSYNGNRQIVGYSPVPGINGWGLGVYAPVFDFTYATFHSIFITILLLTLTLVITLIVIHRLSRGIGDPVNQCAQRISLLVEGDLHTQFPQIHTNNEIGTLVHATQEHLGSLNLILQDMDYCLGEIANGNFAISSKATESYRGDFQKVVVSVEGICNRLNDTLTQIDYVAEQVSAGASQVSRDAQTLSQGAAQQADSITGLFETINETADQIKANSDNAVLAKGQADISGKNVEDSNRQMQTLAGAMHEINEKSAQISKIIKTIDDIAFQTNILALNAAVEAARAGAAGKGFSVVADEVRNLAGKSAKAAKDTATLIEESIQAVEHGTKIADATAVSMDTVVNGVKSVISLIDEISVSSNEQAGSVGQIISGLEQISTVVQTNRASSQESASASRELSDQAQTLKALVGKFNLRNNHSEHAYSRSTRYLED